MSPERPSPTAILGLLLCVAPVFVLTLSTAANEIFFLGSLGAGWLLLRRSLPAVPVDSAGAAQLLAWVLAAPLLAALFGALLRGGAPNFSQFDAPARFAVAIPILYFVLRSRFDPAPVLACTLPLGLAIPLAHRLINGNPEHWPPDRMTAALIDPLTFGYMSLAFALMCLFSIAPGEWRGPRRWQLIAALVGVGLGLFMSIASGSRSGWAALPLLAIVWLHLHWGRNRRHGLAIIVAAVVVSAAAAYLVVPVVHDRIHIGIDEFVNYPWHGMAPETDTAVGRRITFARIAADLVVAHPWAGVGDTHRIVPSSLAQFPYADAETVRLAFQTFFHNQMLTDTVRSGVLGFVATAALLLVPLGLCVRGLGAESAQVRRVAGMGVAYFAVIFVSSLTTEVVDLKFLANFYGLMVALLCGAVVGSSGPHPTKDPISA